MKLSVWSSIIRHSIQDTVRQSFWAGTFWVLTIASVVTAAACFGVHFTEATTDRPGTKSYLFGITSWETHRTIEQNAREFGYGVAGLGASTFGLLLALAATAGYFPAVLHPDSALIELAKPAPRWLTMLARYIGVLILALFHVVVFVFFVWLAIGLATGVWSAALFWAIPAFLYQFAIFFSFSTLLAVSTRNTVACVFGTVLFWSLCWLMNIGRHALIVYDVESFTGASRIMSDAAYWILPKPADFLMVLWEPMTSRPVGFAMLDVAKLEASGGLRPLASMASSVLFPLVVLLIACYELETADY